MKTLADMKKGLITILLIIVTLYCHAQDLPIKIQKRVNRETLRICDILQIAVRPNISKDSTIRFYIDESVPNDILNCRFSLFDRRNVVGDILDTFRYYLRSNIFLSKTEYKVVSKSIDTSKKIYYKAMAILLHEFTHYLQVTGVENEDYYYPKSLDSISMGKYFSQPIEFEATCVQAYYFLIHMNKKKIKEIMSANSSLLIKKHELINEFYRETYPWRKGRIFPNVL